LNWVRAGQNGLSFTGPGRHSHERSGRPPSPHATPPATVELVLQLRNSLATAGLDTGADTIGWHLTRQHQISVSRAAINRILARHDLVTPEPAKRPKSSYIRFQAAMPNQCWQSDFTHYRLTRPDGTPRHRHRDLDLARRLFPYALSLTAHWRVTGPIVLATFRATIATHGIPASTLTDNGMVFTTRFSGGKGGATTSNTNCADSTSPRRTATRITPRPRARSNDSSRP
jgi:hypothetical protein